MKTVEVCLSPELIKLRDLRGKVAVVTDILRASSAMVTALAEGVEAILPVSDLDACRLAKDKGYLGAAERGGKKVDGFELGNSPYDYMNPELKGKKVCLTTTNGTRAIQLSLDADQVYVGAFLNLKATAEHLRYMEKDIIVICAGWKGHVNLEDSLYGGALALALNGSHQREGDGALMASTLFLDHQKNLLDFVSKANHAQRLAGLQQSRDMEMCLALNRYDIVARMEGEELKAI